MIVADNLRKEFEDGFVAVDGVSFEVTPGEVFALLGPNGAGKTTTVSMLLGFIEPTGGSARINGEDILEAPLEAKKYVGYVSENVLLYGNLTALQNLRFFANLSNVKRTDEELEELLGRVGLGDDARRRVGAFSKGMRQRLGIAIALVKDPLALILDEPTSGLDPAGARDLMRILSELRDEGKALLLVTHDLFRAKVVADRIAIMRGGEVAEVHGAHEVQDIERLYMEVQGLALTDEGEVTAPVAAEEAPGAGPEKRPDEAPVAAAGDGADAETDETADATEEVA